MNTVDIKQLDVDISFLRDEANRLRQMPNPPQWAHIKAARFDAIAERLRQIRQHQQMTTMKGERLQD